MKNIYDLILDTQLEQEENLHKEGQDNKCFLEMVSAILEFFENRK